MAVSLLVVSPDGRGVPAAPDHPRATSEDGAAASRAGAAYRNLPLRFEANGGQVDARVDFLARGRDYTVFLTPTEAVLALRQPAAGAPAQAGEEVVGVDVAPRERGEDEHPAYRAQRRAGRDASGTHGPRRAVLRLHLVGANPQPRAVGREALSGRVSYFRGDDATQWRTDIPTYERVSYGNVHPGVDLVYHGSRKELGYEFVVAPGADTSVISVSFPGVEGMEIAAEGALILHTASGEVRQRKPLAYQEMDGARHEVAASFVPRGPRQVGFAVAAYDASRPLVIASALVHTMSRAASEDPHIAVDAQGNGYLTGTVDSASWPSTAEAFDASYHRGGDAFVAKLDAAGSTLVYSTYLGGNGEDVGTGIAVDAAGNTYVGGTTDSANFPTTAGAIKTAGSGKDFNAFVAKLNPQGTALVYSTLLGGSSGNQGSGIAVDGTGNAYVTGFTDSADFPTTPEALQRTLKGSSNAFVTKLNPQGTALVYSTYLGGSRADLGDGIAVDGAGNAYVTGHTLSTDFPMLNPVQSVLRRVTGNFEVFVAKLNALGTALVYSTFLGGGDDEFPAGIAVDSAGSAYVTGWTKSRDFPTTPGALDTNFHGGFQDAFVTKLNAQGTALVYSTFLGGIGSDQGNAIAVDAAGNAYVVGNTTSLDFPTTPGAFDTTFHGGINDAFVTKLNPQGTALVYSAFLGGSGDDRGTGIAIDGAGNAYVAAISGSADFPATAAAFRRTSSGGRDAAVAKLNAAGAALVYSTFVGSAEDRGRDLALRALGVPLNRSRGGRGNAPYPGGVSTGGAASHGSDE